MTYKQLSDRVAAILGMQFDTSSTELPLIQDWIYEGIIDILSRTRPNLRVINLTVQPNTEVHDLSNIVLSLVDMADSHGFLTRYTREDMLMLQRRYERGYAFEEPLMWLSPILDKETTVKAYGIFKPERMQSPDHTPSLTQFGGLTEDFHPSIVTYACWKGGEYTEHEQSGGGERWRLQYEGQDGRAGEISKLKAILAKRVTPHGPRRRNPMGYEGHPSDSLHYVGG